MKLTDLHNLIEEQFPGKVVGLSQPTADPSSAVVNHWADNVTKADKDAVNAFIATFDFSAPSVEDLNAQITQKLKAAAKDKALTDTDFIAYRDKLERAKHIDVLADKQAKIDEAEALKP